MRRFVIISLLAILPIFASGQNECAFILQEAQEMFDAGLIEAIPAKLSSCLAEEGFTKDEELQAYKLIILSYLFDDNMEEAESSMLEFLQSFPAYIPVATDPQEFITLMKTYDTRPVLMLGGSLGLNFSFPVATGRVGVFNYSEYPGNYAPGGAGFHGSFRVSRRVNSNLDLTAEALYAYNRFDFYLDTDVEDQSFTGEITDFSIIDYYETQNRIYLPLGATYKLFEGKFNPFVSAGIVPSLLFDATGEGLRQYKNTGDTRYDPVPVAGVKILEMRRVFNAWAYIGAGAKYKIGPGEFFMDARFYVNLLNQVRPGADRFNQKLAFESFYVSDDLLLNNLTISAGYMFPIYNPKKKE